MATSSTHTQNRRHLHQVSLLIKIKVLFTSVYLLIWTGPVSSLGGRDVDGDPSTDSAALPGRALWPQRGHSCQVIWLLRAPSSHFSPCHCY